MGNIKDFVNRPRSSPLNLPIAEDKPWGYVVVGHTVRMSLGSRTRTYWYPTIEKAIRAYMKFEKKKKWPLRKNVRSSVDTPPPAAV